jgi:hypothetical protein
VAGLKLAPVGYVFCACTVKQVKTARYRKIILFMLIGMCLQYSLNVLCKQYRALGIAG